VKAYLDSSVLLRVLLGQPGRLREWARIEEGVASRLVEVECLRVLDRLRLAGAVDDERLAGQREYRLTGALDLVEVTPAVLSAASQPMPTVLGTLDAIHLATGMMWRDVRDPDLVMATHDRGLALAARASGFAVIGV
jgi:predicted nucleic acid-binding protein